MRKVKKSGESEALARLIHDFCWDWLPSQLTKSEGTLRSYRTSMRIYVSWLGDEGVTPSSFRASDFGTARIEAWLAWLASERGNGPTTCNARLAAVRKFCSYASDHDATFATLRAGAAAVPQRKSPKTKVRGMSEAAVAAIAGAPDQTSRQGRRDVTIIVTLYGTAARVGELLSMRVSQLRLDAEHPHARVVGKGGKGRAVYLPERCVEHLRAYLDEFHGPDPRPESYLFWSRNHPAGTHPLSRDAVADMLRKHAAAARETCHEVPERVTPHTFRHARASHWLDRKVHIAQISLLLGHANIQTTMDYLDITVDDLEEAMRDVAGTPEPKRWKGCESSMLAYCGLAES